MPILSSYFPIAQGTATAVAVNYSSATTATNYVIRATAEDWIVSGWDAADASGLGTNAPQTIVRYFIRAMAGVYEHAPGGYVVRERWGVNAPGGGALDTPGSPPRVYAEPRQEAATRALALLRSCLTPEQVAQMEDCGNFDVRARSGRLYRLWTHTMAGNVEEIDERDRVALYCAHPSGVPTADGLLAQKLMLETDDEEFRRIANCHYRRAG